jgi:hypothetical protein
MIALFIHKVTLEDIQCQPFRQIDIKIQLQYLLKTVDFVDFTFWPKTFPWKTSDYCSYLLTFGNTD